jgi:excisionase family DNA binding protein
MGKGMTAGPWPKAGEEMYAVRPAAKTLGIQEKTLRVWLASGRIGCVRYGRTIRVPLSELNRIITEGYRPAKSA